MTEEQLQDLARDMFNAYNDAGPNPWRTFDGRPVPTWDEVTDQVHRKWVAAARKAVEFTLRIIIGA